MSIYLLYEAATPFSNGGANVSQVHRDWIVPLLIHCDFPINPTFAWTMKKITQKQSKTYVRKDEEGRERTRKDEEGRGKGRGHVLVTHH